MGLHSAVLEVIHAPDDDLVLQWKRLLSRVRLEDFDAPAQRLLPLVFERLRELPEGKGLSSFERLKGVYRHSWSGNQIRLRHAARALAELQAGGVEPLLLKGAALIPTYYSGNPGLRVVSDVDVLVRPTELESAVRILVSKGWRPRHGDPGTVVSRDVKVKHAIAFVNGLSEVDLHWNVLPCDQSTWLAEVAWNRRVEVAFFGLNLARLDSTTLLFHVCVHGMCYSQVRPLLWVCDAMRILSDAIDPIDWEYFRTLAIQRRLTLPVASALGYLATVLGAPISANVLSALSRVAVTRIEMLEFEALRTRWGGVRGDLARSREYLRRARREGASTVVLGDPLSQWERMPLDQKGHVRT